MASTNQKLVSHFPQARLKIRKCSQKKCKDLSDAMRTLVSLYFVYLYRLPR